MKDTIIAIIILVLGVFAFVPAIKNANYYATAAVVTDVDFEKNQVTFTTYEGFEYQTKGVEDWFIGDFASLCMNDKGTEFITDDVVISARYSRVQWDSPKTFANNLQKGR